MEQNTLKYGVKIDGSPCLVLFETFEEAKSYCLIAYRNTGVLLHIVRWESR